ncbi:Uncharacterized protein TPAR_03076 [Tolypocladium paradoxum]|uniref:WSC domain-containing protein n=1 Tax=Tolypocladium paradoxum TaxID=94208 RepID=A0A2S4L2Q6_9HYPO|nr:Uncharacterized protein TPAR_03076 [Tolypocladium paradoxum]
MTRAALVAALLVALSAAQSDHAAPGFRYLGCVRADPAAFPMRPGLAHPFSPDKCQEACGPKAAYAALGNGGCHCDDAASRREAKWDAVDEEQCCTLCDERDEKGGHCGGPGKDGKGVFNLYMKIPTGPRPPPEEDEDCEEGKGMKPTRPPVETTMVRAKATVIDTISSCPPEVPDCPAKKKHDCLAEGCRPPPPPPTSAPRPHPTHANCTRCPPKAPPPGCTGDCPGNPPGPPTKMPIYTPAPPATNAPVIVSEASAQQWNRAMALLGLGAVALAVGPS